MSFPEEKKQTRTAKAEVPRPSSFWDTPSPQHHGGADKANPPPTLLGEGFVTNTNFAVQNHNQSEVSFSPLFSLWVLEVERIELHPAVILLFSLSKENSKLKRDKQTFMF